MASPLATIRKYDKVLLAVFGVLLMLSFLVADPLSMMSGRGVGTDSGPRAGAPVTFKGGSLSEEQLMRMHRADALADMYVQRVRFAAQQASKDASPGLFPYADGSSDEARLVHHYLLARKAHEMGLSLSNQDIDDLLINMADNAIDRDELKKIRQKLLSEDLNSTIIITESDLYAQLRTNFLAQELMAMVRHSTWPIQAEAMGSLTPTSIVLPPGRAWELFRRTARQAKVELLPLEVEKFLDDVTKIPTAREKDELFEKHKDDVPSPYSPEPGFASPHKIAFGYVRVSLQPFLDKAKAEVTEEAIRANYDERAEKGEFTVPVEEKKQEEKSDDDPKESQPDDAKPEDEKPAKEEDKGPAEKPTDEPKENDVKDEDAAKEENEEQDNDDEEEEPAESNAPAEQDNPSTGDARPADDTKPEDAEPDDKQPDDKQPGDKKPEDTKPEDTKPKTRTKTFEEMKDSIRDQLAQKPAFDTQREAVDELFKAVDEFRAKYHEWEIEKKALADAPAKDKSELAAEPELLPSISGVLKKYDFKYQQTELLDAYEIQETEIGKVSVGHGAQSFPLQQIYMFSDVELYRAFAANEGFLGDTQYLLWKEADQPQRTAQRKEVEEELVRAVKMKEAFNLAKAQAEELAAKAREQADKSLLASLGGVDKAAAIVEPAPFSWLSNDFVPGGMGFRLQVTEIPEVDNPGEEFMQTVLDLQPGEIGVAADDPHKRVYVIRMIDQTPKEEILRQMFLAKGINDRNVSQQYASERVQTIGEWMEDVVTDEMQLKWHRTPQQFGQ